MSTFAAYVSYLRKNEQQKNEFLNTISINKDATYIILFRLYLMWLIQTEHKTTWTAYELLNQAAIANAYYIQHLITRLNQNDELPPLTGNIQTNTSIRDKLMNFERAVQSHVEQKVLGALTQHEIDYDRKVLRPLRVGAVCIAAAALLSNIAWAFVAPVALEVLSSVMSMLIICAICAGVYLVSERPKLPYKKLEERYVKEQIIPISVNYYTHNWNGAIPYEYTVDQYSPAHVSATGDTSEKVFNKRKVAVRQAVESIRANQENVQLPSLPLFNKTIETSWFPSVQASTTPSPLPVISSITDEILNKYKGVYTSYTDFQAGKGLLPNLRGKEQQLDLLSIAEKVKTEEQKVTGLSL